MIKIFKYLGARDWGLVALCLGFVVFQVWLDLKIPDYMAVITTLVQTPGTEMSQVLTEGAKMLACALGSLAGTFIVGYLSAYIAASFSRKIRKLVFDKVESFSLAEMNGFSTASLITRSTNDITQIQLIIALGLQAIIRAPIMAIWAITKIADKAWQWTTATAVAVAMLLAIITVIIIFVIPNFKKIQGLTDDINRVMRENITGIRVVRAYNAEDYQQNKFDVYNTKLTQINLTSYRFMSVMMPGMNFISSCLTMSIYWLGAFIINGASGLTDKIGLFSDMVVFTSYAMQVVMSFMLLIMIFVLGPRAMVSAHRINEVLDTKNTINDGANIGLTDKQNRGLVQFKNVGFAYPDAGGEIVKNISFEAKPGQTLAIIGATGSGKSSIVKLIPRLYDATSGEVLVDGINVKDYTLEALRNRIGYVPQKAVLFSGTVSSNVGYGSNGGDGFSEQCVKEAVETAQAKEFVEEKEGEYEASVAQGGSNFSGGQKQRLSIARAIARKPEIFIFDDSFSALDYKTDRILRSSLKERTGDATVIIVAQRIGTIRDADRILVLDKGEIVGDGTHEELMKNCAVYQEIAYSQLSKEELENE